MSITPDPTPTRNAVHEVNEAPRYRWYHKLGSIIFAFFCFEVGVFLILFPWLTLWDANYFSLLTEDWRQVWMSPYFRGAVSGVGIVNIYIAVLEVFRLRRFAAPDHDDE